jgi:hypothetical protein
MTKSFSFSWILMWGLAYIICAIIKPDIMYGVPRIVAMIFFLFYGCSILFGLILNAKIILFGMGVAEVIGGVASWVGLIVWSAPWIPGYDPIVQISMSILDLVSAVFLFHYSFEIIEKYFVVRH